MKQPTNANREHFFNQLDDHLKPLKTNHLIKLLKANPHLKFSFLHYQPLTQSIPVTTHHHFSSWHFPKNLSQSSIQGRSGSNACTIIALTIAKLFYTFPLQSIDPTAAINSTLTLTLNQGSTTIF